MRRNIYQNGLLFYDKCSVSHFRFNSILIKRQPPATQTFFPKQSLKLRYRIRPPRVISVFRPRQTNNKPAPSLAHSKRHLSVCVDYQSPKHRQCSVQQSSSDLFSSKQLIMSWLFPIYRLPNRQRLSVHILRRIASAVQSFYPEFPCCIATARQRD